MKIKETYSVFVTKQLTITKDFYVNVLQFSIFFESSWFILLQSEGERPYYIAFMDEEHPTSPPSMPALDPKSGVFLTLEVDDAKTEYEKLEASGVEIFYHLHEELWGQKRFGLVDPNGLYIDVVEQIAPQDGFWDQYMV